MADSNIMQASSWTTSAFALLLASAHFSPVVAHTSAHSGILVIGLNSNISATAAPILPYPGIFTTPGGHYNTRVTSFLPRAFEHESGSDGQWMTPEDAMTEFFQYAESTDNLNGPTTVQSQSTEFRTPLQSL
jgi:hypothetical protein